MARSCEWNSFCSLIKKLLIIFVLWTCIQWLRYTAALYVLVAVIRMIIIQVLNKIENGCNLRCHIYKTAVFPLVKRWRQNPGNFQGQIGNILWAIQQNCIQITVPQHKYLINSKTPEGLHTVPRKTATCFQEKLRYRTQCLHRIRWISIYAIQTHF